jgi:hypothetical protein
MKQFRFETEVETTVVNEYFIEADSLEEALSLLQNGEYRDEGIIITENFHWETEIITVKEEMSK